MVAELLSAYCRASESFNTLPSVLSSAFAMADGGRIHEEKVSKLVRLWKSSASLSENPPNGSGRRGALVTDESARKS